MLVKIIPLSQRSHNRVNEHGEKMLLIINHPDRFLVESLDKTWGGQKWLGWFDKTEAEFEEAN